MLKRFLLASLILMLSLAVVGCGNDKEEAEETPTPPATEDPAEKDEPEEETGKYDDGIYYAERDTYAGSGWMYNVTLEVEGGNITDVEWNATNMEGGPDKVALGEDYGMKAAGSDLEWDEQAKEVEALLLESQDVNTIDYNTEDGLLVDEIAGVSISVDDFVELVNIAIDNGPVAEGNLKDGFYYAQDDEAGDEFHNFAHVAVKNGSIVGVNLNALVVDPEEDGAKNKYTLAADGDYGMKEAGSEFEWHEQVDKVAEQIIASQDPSSISFDDEGTPDDIAGVSITMNFYVDLVEKALADAK